jgi:DNA-binding CsgD family transcriptional regulator
MPTVSERDRAFVRDLVARTRLGDVEADLMRTNTVGAAPDRRARAIAPRSDQRNLASGLGARQQEVALLVGTGHTIPETAQVLGLAIQTVKAHLRAIYRKLGVRNQAQLGAWAAFELGQTEWEARRA